jgi:RNA-directed DNA polymerase
LSIPRVRDRIVQAATKIVIEPIYEADFLPAELKHHQRAPAVANTSHAVEHGTARVEFDRYRD